MVVLDVDLPGVDFLFAELLAPVVEAAGLVITVVCTLAGLLSPLFAVAFFLTAYLFGSLRSLAAILMEEVSFHRYRRPADTFRLLVFAFIEPFGYRQITVYDRLKSFWKFFRGDHSWGRMSREGFGSPVASAKAARPTSAPPAVAPAPAATESSAPPPAAKLRAATPSTARRAAKATSASARRRPTERNTKKAA